MNRWSLVLPECIFIFLSFYSLMLIIGAKKCRVLNILNQFYLTFFLNLSFFFSFFIQAPSRNFKSYFFDHTLFVKKLTIIKCSVKIFWWYIINHNLPNVFCIFLTISCSWFAISMNQIAKCVLNLDFFLE